jgi:amino acid transporter
MHWFPWALTSLGIIICAFIPNVWSQNVLRWMLRLTVVSFSLLFLIYWIWLPTAVARHGKFQHASIFRKFYNGINKDGTKEASNAYCWVIGMLFAAWEFYGYDASVHLSEETKSASLVVAKGIWTGTLTTWLMSIPTLMLMFLCIQEFDEIVKASWTNNFAEYLTQIVGKKAAIVILCFCWLDSILATAVCFMSAQRVTYAIARDNVLPGSSWIKKLSKNRMPVNAAIVVLVVAIVMEASIIASTVAFTALTATATISTNLSYVFPIVARHMNKGKKFKRGHWSLGKYSKPIGVIAVAWVLFLFVVLMLPQVFPVTAVSLPILN